MSGSYRSSAISFLGKAWLFTFIQRIHTMTESFTDQKVIIITKEDAKVRMDKDGRWLNEDDPITKPSIIRYLNASILKDEQGYYLTHMLGNKREKVYFEYEDTALFAIDLKKTNTGISLLLNTKRRLTLQPEGLFLKADSLYLRQEGHVIKFHERAVIKLTPYLKESEDGLMITLNGEFVLINNC
jgi:hypothetical protein